MIETLFQMSIVNKGRGYDCINIAIEDHSWSDPNCCALSGFGYDGFAILNREEAALLGEALLKWSKSG